MKTICVMIVLDGIQDVKLDSIKRDYVIDEYNELVNFYFEVYKESEECKFCDQVDMQRTKQNDDWYDFPMNTGKVVL